MEKKLIKISSAMTPSIHKILYWGKKINDFVSNSLLFLQSLPKLVSIKLKIWTKLHMLSHQQPLNQLQSCIHDDDKSSCNEKLSEGDIKIVMERLRLSYDPDHKLQDQVIGADEVSKLFEDEDPSLEEIKEAFDVFDENRDGFIDETELQRVLCCLGLKEGSTVEECRRMIKVVDENGDGKIDIVEFVKFMELCLC